MTQNGLIDNLEMICGLAYGNCENYKDYESQVFEQLKPFLKDWYDEETDRLK